MDAKLMNYSYEIKRAQAPVGNHPPVVVDGLYKPDQGAISAGCPLTRETVGNFYIPWSTSGEISDIKGIADENIDTSSVTTAMVIKHGGVLDKLLHIGTDGQSMPDEIKIKLPDINIFPVGE